MKAGQKLGYIRVSTVDQNTERQLQGFELDRVFIDKCSGNTIKRPELINLKEYAREGDQIYIHSLDRLGRNLEDLKLTINYFVSNGVKVTFVNECLNFAGDEHPISNLLLNVMGSFAQFERELLKERQREGIKIAKEIGLYKGRKPLAIEGELKKSIDFNLDCGVKKIEICRSYKISKTVLYKYIKNRKSKNEK